MNTNEINTGTGKGEPEPTLVEPLGKIAELEKQRAAIVEAERETATVTAVAHIPDCQLPPKEFVGPPIRGNRMMKRKKKKQRGKAKFKVEIRHVVNFWQVIDVLAYSVEHARQQASDMTEEFYNMEDAEGGYKRYEPGEVTVYGPLPIDG